MKRGLVGLLLTATLLLPQISYGNIESLNPKRTKDFGYFVPQCLRQKLMDAFYIFKGDYIVEHNECGEPFLRPKYNIEDLSWEEVLGFQFSEDFLRMIDSQFPEFPDKRIEEAEIYKYLIIKKSGIENICPNIIELKEN